MCGIAGIIFKEDHHQDWAPTALNNMLEVMAHRGPDGRGHFIEDGVLLGHLRLAVIDIRNGAQPMISNDGSHILVFNGEIYNYIELRLALISKGHQFKTTSDSEVLLYMYIEYGENMLQYLNGMFSFLIYDKNEKKAFAARDHFGIKPFYFIETTDFFAFASEIKALFQIPEIKAEALSESLYEYITFQYTLGNNTLFKGIEKLEPAYCVSLQSGHVKNKRRYWELDYTPNYDKNADEYADNLLVLINNAVNIQMRSDVPVGVYLSGGLDSSTLAVLASKHTTESLLCFTGAFHESADYDETLYARIVTDYIGGQQKEIYPEWSDFTKHFEHLIWLMDEPAAGPGLFSQFMVSKLASEHVKVVLGGQGADEMFGGYIRYNIAYLEQCIKGAIFETAEEDKYVMTLASMTSNLPSLKNYIPLIRQQFSKGLFDPMDKRYFNLVNRAPEAEKYYTPEFRAEYNKAVLFEKFGSIFNDTKTASLFNKMTYFDLRTLLPALLHVEDRVSMGNSIESRVPLIDKNIAELAASIPPMIKFDGGKNKHILIEAVKNILPNQIVQRKDKMGFPTPINEWLSGPARGFALDILTSQKARQRGVLNTIQVEKQLHKDGKFSRDLWGALCLETWFRTFIDKI